MSGGLSSSPRNGEARATLPWPHRLVVLAFLLALALTGLFANRTVQRALYYWHTHADEQIRPWMSLGYIANSYHVPPEVLYQALGLPPDPPDRRPLVRIAHSQKRPVEELEAVLQTAILHARPGASP